MTASWDGDVSIEPYAELALRVGRIDQILLVGGDAAYSASLCGILRSVGYTVHTERSGMSALRYAQRRCPDLVICDLEFTDMEPHRFYPELRNRCHVMQMPVVFLTGTTVPDALRRSRIRGPRVCVRKWSEPAELLAVIALVLA